MPRNIPYTDQSYKNVPWDLRYRGMSCILLELLQPSYLPTSARRKLLVGICGTGI